MRENIPASACPALPACATGERRHRPQGEQGADPDAERVAVPGGQVHRVTVTNPPTPRWQGRTRHHPERTNPRCGPASPPSPSPPSSPSPPGPPPPSPARVPPLGPLPGPPTAMRRRPGLGPVGRIGGRAELVRVPACPDRDRGGPAQGRVDPGPTTAVPPPGARRSTPTRPGTPTRDPVSAADPSPHPGPPPPRPSPHPRWGA
jgi:hypothetical protein